ncbi:MAG: STAS domain-containing protein [Lachnospiraceae bacterium]|nr:STAS domain-containing protein [Lachnospiraceae bacterium]
MTITKKTENELLTMELDGRLDTNTAPSLEQEINNSITEEVKKLVLDFKQLQYISSAGLRVLLATQKKMNKQGCMVIKNVNEMIMDVFHVTGFIDILTVE